MLMSWKAAREPKFILAVSYLLVITVTSLFLHYSLDGMPGQSRIEAIEKAPIKGLEGPRQKAANKSGLAINKSTANLSLVSSFSLLRFDFKQNLRTWPVLSNDLERSPPVFTVL
jgi:hypothetical protein